MPDDHVLGKLDFVNVFNSVRRDTILESTANNIPELYKFCWHLIRAKQNSCLVNILFYRVKVLNKEIRSAQLNSMTPYTKHYLAATPERNLATWTISNSKVKFKS